MDILDLIFPLLILIGPAILKSFSDKKKAEKERAERQGSRLGTMDSNKPPKKVNNMDSRDRRIQDNIEKRKSQIQRAKESIEKKIQDTINTFEGYNKEEKAITKVNKTTEIPVKEDKPVVRKKAMFDEDLIKENEIGSDNIDLKFDKKDLVKGIIMSEILAPPKALQNKNRM